MATTTRTISPGAWAEASFGKTVESKAMTETVNRCMAELDQPGPTTYKTGYSPWLDTGGRCYGAMWAGVPDVEEYWKDSKESWLISPYLERASSHKPLIRLCPALPGAEVQYGLCTIQGNRIGEIAQRYFGARWEQLNIASMPIGNSLTSAFRADRMAIAAVRLGEKRSAKLVGRQFRALLGRMDLSVFIKDMLRGSYADSFWERNILIERDHQYRELVQLVAENAYPGFLKLPPEVGKDLSRFKLALQLDKLDGWADLALFPWVYNIVMPAPIFKEVDENLKLGIPPILPQYVINDHWMFNGSWSEPCTGLEMSGVGVVSLVGQKIAAGVVNSFNCDLSGGVGYWPFNRNPPIEWIDLFVGQLQRLREQQIPLSMGDRTDLSLFYARGIPVVIDIRHTDSPRTLRYSKLVGLNTDDKKRVTRIVTRECNTSGEWIGPPEPSSADPPSTDESEEEVGSNPDLCVNCSNELGEDEGYDCNTCSEPLCGGCTFGCTGCDGSFCPRHVEDHECSR